MSVEINATNFQDAAFRQFVIDNYDINHDGILSDSEIAAVTSMELNGLDINTLYDGFTGIEYFTSLETLVVTGCNTLRSIVLKAPTSLVSISVSNCSYISEFKAFQELINLEEVNISGCANLDQLWCRGANPDNYLSNISRDETYHSALQTLTIENCQSITDLECLCNSVTSINLSGLNRLRGLDLRCSLITSLDLSDCVSLERLYYWNGNLRSISFGQINALKQVFVHGNSLTSIDMPYSPNCQKLYIYWNNIQETDIGKLPLILKYCPVPDENDVVFDYRDESPVKARASSSTANPNVVFDTSTLIKARNTNIQILTQPKSQIIENGDTVTISVVASGSDITYRWEVKKKESATWEFVDNANTNTISFIASEADDGAKYQCQLSNADNSAYSQIATITVLSEPTITTHPQDTTVTEGMSVVLQTAATGNALYYQWQTSADGGETWSDVRNATNPRYSFMANMSINGYEYRCVVTNTVGTVTSDAATLTVEEDPRIAPPSVNTQPVSQTIDEGQTATFSVSATGTGVTYQWQTLSGGSWYTWYSIDGATSNTYSVTGSAALNGRKYRCVVTNEAGSVISNAASLTVNYEPPSPGPEPTPTPVGPGTETNFMINGVDITRLIKFQGLKWGRNDVDGPNAGRNMAGEMIRDRVATKIRLDVTCKPMVAKDHTMLMKLLMPEFVTVMYNDPVYGYTTKIMYANNNNSEYCIRKPNGTEYWYNVTFPLIEK